MASYSSGKAHIIAIWKSSRQDGRLWIAVEAVIEGGGGGTTRERRAEAFVVNCKVGGTVVFGRAAYSRGWTTFARAC
jgi:hypothetical protein